MINIFAFFDHYMQIFILKKYISNCNPKSPNGFYGALHFLEIASETLGYEESAAVLDGLLTAFCATDYAKNMANCSERDIADVHIAFILTRKVLVLMERLSSAVTFPLSNVHKNMIFLTNIQKCLVYIYQMLLECDYIYEERYFSIYDCYISIRTSLKRIITNQAAVYHSVGDVIELFTEEDRAKAYDLVKFAFSNEDDPIHVTDAHLSTEVTNCQTWVPMWLKVRRARTREDLLQLASDHFCVVCQHVDLEEAENFVFFDLCGHMLCVECTFILFYYAAMFQIRCPCCGIQIGAYMTLETFTKHRIAMDARENFPEVVVTSLKKRLIYALRNASLNLGALFLIAIFCSGLAVYFGRV